MSIYRATTVCLAPCLVPRCSQEQDRLSLDRRELDTSHFIDRVGQSQGHTVLSCENESPGPLTTCPVFSPEFRQWVPLPLRGSGSFLEWL